MYRGAFQQTDTCGETETDQISSDHKSVADHKGNHKLPCAHVMLFDGRHVLIPHQGKGNRETQHVERHHGDG